MRHSRLFAVLFALPLIHCAEREVPIAPEPVVVNEAPKPVRQNDAVPSRAGAGVALPPANNGVLAPGAADQVLRVGGKPVVKLLEGGAEPRSDLSYALSKGQSQKMSMAMDMAVGIKMKGQAAPTMPLPRMIMIFDTAATDKNAVGEFKIDSRLISTSVSPSGGQQEQMAKALAPQLESMKGLGMSYWVNPKGNVHDAKLDIPASVPASAQQIMSGMSQSVESMVTPLPSEPVGVGARWQVISRLATGGADILQSAIYTLKSRTGSKATLEITLTQLAASDTIHTAQMPAGMSAKVKSFNSSGGGTSAMDLKSVAPENGSMTLKTTMEIGVQGGGATSADDSAVDTTTTITIGRP